MRERRQTEESDSYNSLRSVLGEIERTRKEEGQENDGKEINKERVKETKKSV